MYTNARTNPVTLTLASLRRRGLMGTLNRVISVAAGIGFDLRYGIDTMGCVSMDALKIESEHKERGVRYEPSELGAVRRLLQMPALPRNGLFVDLGSGKGRVLLIAAQCGFRRIVGVEFSPELC